MSGATIKREGAPLLLILLGNLLIAFGYAKFMVPSNIISGGVTSLSMVLARLTPLSVVTWTNMITVGCLVFALIFLGRTNFIRSIVSSFAYMGFFALWTWVPLNLAHWPWLDVLLASLFIGAGYYCCIASNASTAGLDVFALIAAHKNPQLNVTLMLRVINVVVLLGSTVVFGWAALVWGLAFTFLYSGLMGWLLRRYRPFPKVKTTK
ncbi:MAG: YitT family protein [Schleiferilactobacillus harbinensis]